MSSLLEVKLFKNNKWKTMLPLTGFSLCKPNIYNGWRHTLSLWRIRYKLCRHLVCYHCLNNSGLPQLPQLPHPLNIIYLQTNSSRKKAYIPRNYTIWGFRNCFQKNCRGPVSWVLRKSQVSRRGRNWV